MPNCICKPEIILVKPHNIHCCIYGCYLHQPSTWKESKCYEESRLSMSIHNFGYAMKNRDKLEQEFHLALETAITTSKTTDSVNFVVLFCWSSHNEERAEKHFTLWIEEKHSELYSTIKNSQLISVTHVFKNTESLVWLKKDVFLKKHSQKW